MQPITYFEFETDKGLETYISKSKQNIKLFESIFRMSPEKFNNQAFEVPEGENSELIKKISQTTGLSFEITKGVNRADEALNSQDLINMFGCTAIAKNNVVGQTMDLFTVELCLVREKEALYVTMPPYLTLMGMSKNIAFCTNYIPGIVQEGVPVSHIRRDLLRQKNVDKCIKYVEGIKRTTPVNFLVTDGNKTVDLELTPDDVKVYDAAKNGKDEYCAHTNHLIKPNFVEDKYCPRLKKAVQLLQKNEKLENILDNEGIYMPVLPITGDYGFGTIVQVVMDVKNRKFTYKDNSMKEYKTIDF